MDRLWLAVAAALVALLTAGPAAAQQFGRDAALSPAQHYARAAGNALGGMANSAESAFAPPGRQDVARLGAIAASYARQKADLLGCCPTPAAEEESGCAAKEEEPKEEKEEPCVECCSGPLGCWGCGPCLYELGDPFKLGNHLPRLKKHDIDVGGWIAQSYTWNPYNPSDGFNGPVTWTDRSNEYQLNEAWIYAVKPTDTKGAGWDFGWRADTFYGTSYRWDTEAGLETNINSGQFYGLALPQFYGEIAYNDLKVKVGHFISPVGFYTVGTYNNFFNTIPYTYQYGEPFTHTGFLANYQVNERVNLGAGLIHGWDAFDSSFNKWGGYLGTASISGNADDSLAFVQVYSHEPTQNAAQPFSQRYLQTLVYSRPLKKIDDRLAYIIQSDFGVQGQATMTGKTARWYGVNQYLYWKKNDIVSWGVNFEWFRDEEGFRVTAPVPSPGSPNARGWPRAPGFAGNFFQITVGPRWTPLPNVVVRPNFRADWYHGVTNSEGLKPFDGGTKNLQQILATDVIVTY